MIALSWYYPNVRGKGFGAVIMSKLLSNAIAPRKLGIAYLFAFVVHIGWITNSTFDILKDECHSCLPLVVAVVGILILVYFFPDAKSKQGSNPQKVFITGISNFSWRPALEKNQKNKVNLISDQIEGLNMIPLVRMFVKVIGGRTDNCKIVVLLSDAYVKINDKIKETFACEYEGNLVPVANMVKSINIAVGEYEKNNDKDKLEVFLRKVIKAFILYTLEIDNEKSQAINNIKIEFTKACDYNNYQNCFDVLDKKIDELEKESDNNEFIFNLTSGNVVVSSVMTLFSIDPERKLYYYSQDPEVSIDKKVLITEKDRLPILRVLSKIMDKIS
jgi:hypothetical protein